MPSQLEAFDEMGVDLAGFIFYPRSPRYMGNKIAADYIRKFKGRIAKVGVFVNVPYEELMKTVEDYRLDIMIDSGPNARSIQLSLNPFTLIGATTRSGLLTAPLLSRFAIKARLEYYDSGTLQKIIHRSSSIMDTKITSDACHEISRRSRGTPRIANGLLRRVRDFAQVLGNGIIDLEITQHSLRALNVDEHGLDDMDNRILTTIIEKFKGGPVGITTISTAVGEETGTIEEVYEPFLIQEGFIMRTPRGREVTAKAYEHLGKKPSNQHGDQLLF